MSYKVLVSMPSTREPKYKTMQSMVMMAMRHKYHYVFHFVEGTLIHQARNQAVVEAVREGCTHLMFIDDDMVFPPSAIDELLEREKDIVGALCFGRKEWQHNYPMIKKIINGNEMVDYKYEEIPTFSDIFEVDATGTAFLLINLNVFKRLDPPFFYFADPTEFGLGKKAFPEDHLSEDVSFMMKARQAGFKIFVDPTITIGHIGNHVYKRELTMNAEVVPTTIEPTAIFIPTVDRLTNVKACVRSIWESTTLPYKIYVMSKDQGIIDWCRKKNVEVFIDEGEDIRYNTRINYMFHHTKEQLVFTASDDIIFHKGWLEALLAGSAKGYGVVGANDMKNRMATNFLVSRKYIEEQSGCMDTKDVIFYPGYQHNFVDTELLAIAKKRNQYVQMINAKVEHKRMGEDGRQYDKTYKWADDRAQEDMFTWHERKKKFNISYSL